MGEETPKKVCQGRRSKQKEKVLGGGAGRLEGGRWVDALNLL